MLNKVVMYQRKDLLTVAGRDPHNIPNVSTYFSVFSLTQEANKSRTHDGMDICLNWRLMLPMLNNSAMHDKAVIGDRAGSDKQLINN